MLRKLSVSLLGVVLLTFSAQAAQVPRTEKDVPLYSGAVRDNRAEAEAATEVEGFHDEHYGSEQGEPLIRRASTLRIYTVAAPAEEIFDFYLRQLGGSEDDPAILYDRPMAAGEVSPIYYNLGFIDFGMYERGDAARMKAELERTRKPLTSGQWVAGAGFHWQVGEANGDFSHFELQLQDDSFYTFDAKGNKRIQTSIVINKTTYMNAADARQAQQGMMDEDEWREEGERAETFRRLTEAPLDPAAVGVAIYPGAKRDAETTRWLQESMALNAGAYRSNDEPVAIIKFYEKQPGFKLVGTDENGGMLKRCREEYNERLKRTISAGCDFDITVQKPWLDMKTGRMNNDTLITLVLTD